MMTEVIVTIDTLVGNTNEITLHDIVKQGRIMGTILYIVETDKINKIGESCYSIYGPEIILDNLLCVDDIAGIGSPMVIANTVKNLKLL